MGSYVARLVSNRQATITITMTTSKTNRKFGNMYVVVTGSYR
jgi:hypothetical protein